MLRESWSKVKGEEVGLRTEQLETTPRIQGSIQTRNRDSVSFQIRILVSNYFYEIQEFQCKER